MMGPDRLPQPSGLFRLFEVPSWRVHGAGSSSIIMGLSMLAAALLLAFACIFAAPSRAEFEPVQLTPSLLLLGSFDYVPYQAGSTQSRCTDMVDRALKYGSSRLHFVPTHYYHEDSVKGITGYCYMDATYSSCLPFDTDAIQLFKSGFSNCLAHAASIGVTSVAVTPHIDSVSSGKTWSIKAWRNGIIFGPLKKYSGYSYFDIMLEPVAWALGTSLLPSTNIYFALQGEMGATVFRYPKDYHSLLHAMKERVQQARQSPGLQQSIEPASADKAGSKQVEGVNGIIKMGLTFNFIFIDGNQSPNASPARFNSIFGFFIGGPLWSRFIAPFLGLRNSGSQDAPAFNKEAVQGLFSDVDFIGISAYAPIKAEFATNELQNSAFSWMQEANAVIGLDMAKLVREKGIELQYAEYGVGGGTGDNGNQAATSANDAAGQPYWGVFGPYQKSKDPWQNSGMKRFMHSFYSKTLQWLAQGGGPTYQISACYLWDLASWDVLAIYPESTNGEGSYRDPDVAAMVTEHNKRVQSR